MLSAASSKRRAGLNSNDPKNKATKEAAVDAKAAPAASSSASKKMKVAPQNASLSEKRRVAALISWEKRRNNSLGNSKASKAKKDVTTSKRKPTVTAARPVTPPKGKKRIAAHAAKRRKTDAGPSNDSTTADGLKANEEEIDPSSGKLYDRSQAAKMGWEKRRNQKAASEIRRKAAKLGWERRRNQSSADSSVATSSASDASLGDERPSAASAVESSSNAKKKAAASSKASKAAAAAASSNAASYTAAARRKAAILGWEKRRNEKAARRSTGSASDDASLVATVPSKAPSSKPQPSKPPPKKEVKPHRQGSKRSRRLNEDSAASYEEEVRKINELVTYLRISRGWMEFHPSSRHGSGTATYGYIPSSIASFIRNGTISQRIVLDHGTLGVHYALDWDGYGGLKEMIDTFGEDFSPYPTEEMMECSLVPEWELGDDLPWREVEEADEKLRKEEEEMATLKEQESGSAANEEEDMEDILFVASILASLDRSSVTDTSDSKECKQDSHQVGNGSSTTMAQSEGPSSTCSPSILALKNYDSSDGYKSETQKNPLSHLADVTVSKGCIDQCTPMSDIVDEDVLILQTRQGFKQWNFGL